MDVKPWEPVTYRWLYAGEQTEDYDAWKWVQFSDPCDRIEGERMAIRITLANGQRIIVRALSEDRKAARAARKAAERACYEAAYAQARAIERGPYGKGDQ